MRGQRTVRERSEYSLTVLSTGSARVNNIIIGLEDFSGLKSGILLRGKVHVNASISVTF